MEGMTQKQLLISSIALAVVLMACLLGLFIDPAPKVPSYLDAAKAGDKFARSVVYFCNDPAAVQNGYCDQLKRQWEKKQQQPK